MTTQISHRSEVRGYSRFRLTVGAFLAVTLLQGPVASLLRIVGAYGGQVSFSQLPVDFATVAVVGGALFFSVTSGRILASPARILALLALAFLVGQLFLHWASGAAEVIVPRTISVGGWDDYGLSTWNTRWEEVTRSLVIFSMYTLFIIFSPRGGNDVRVHVKTVFAIKLFCISLMFMTIITLLQSIEVLPNFAFQWYGYRQLPRPAGGMSHSHYYASLSILAMAAAFYLYKLGELKHTRLLAFCTSMIFGIMLSTSRIGTLVSLLCFIYIISHIRIYARHIHIYIFATLLSLSVLLTVFPDEINRYSSVFLSFLESSGGILRGRLQFWNLEWSVIRHDIITLLWGYGYQPVVSHNLLFRQIQVSGVIGALTYFFLLFLLFNVTRIKIQKEYRSCFYISCFSILVFSITMPVLISLALNSATLLFWAGMMAATRPVASISSSDANTQPITAVQALNGFRDQAATIGQKTNRLSRR